MHTMTELTLRFIFTILVHAATVILVFSMYRISTRTNHTQIAILSVMMGGVYYYIRYGLDSNMYFPATMVVFLLGLMVLRNYPFFYALVVSGIGYFVGGLSDELITFGIMSYFGVSLEQLVASPGLYAFSHICAIVLCLGISYVLRRMDWGFLMIQRRFNNKQWILKGHNFVWAVSLIIGLVIIQVTISNIEWFSLHWFFLLALVVSFSVAMVFTYLENRKVYRDLVKMVQEGMDELEIY